MHWDNVTDIALVPLMLTLSKADLGPCHPAMEIFCEDS